VSGKAHSLRLQWYLTGTPLRYERPLRGNAGRFPRNDIVDKGELLMLLATPALHPGTAHDVQGGGQTSEAGLAYH
jgi:hypothetical protein